MRRQASPRPGLPLAWTPSIHRRVRAATPTGDGFIDQRLLPGRPAPVLLRSAHPGLGPSQWAEYDILDGWSTISADSTVLIGMGTMNRQRNGSGIRYWPGEPISPSPEQSEAEIFGG